MTTETMIERVARSICRAAICDVNTLSDDVEVNDLVDMWWEHSLPEARAALQALREPTEEMEIAAFDAIYARVDEMTTGEIASVVWKSSIDAALQEKT